MRSQSTPPQAAPAQGAAPTATEQRARLLATLARLDEQAAQAASRRISYCLAPASAHDEPATDPARWQGFI
jgi:hypothetical protein